MAAVAQLEAADKLVVSARLPGGGNAVEGIGLFLGDEDLHLERFNSLAKAAA